MNIVKTRKLPNEVLQNNVIVNLENMQSIIPKNTVLTDVILMAGKGVSTILKDEPRLINLYGGKQNNWQKKTGIIISDNFKYEIHFYQCNQKQYEQKTKGVKRII